MMTKARVSITISSTSPDHRIKQSVTGELYRRDDQWIIRYAEPEGQMGRTMTTVKCEPGQIRIIRHGDVESEQTFQLHKRLRGTYQTVQGTLPIESKTHAMKMNMREQQGSIAWTYDLFVTGEFAGKYQLRLDVVEEQ
ncbi:DUF1934 domain-containing protein [Paenibacillus sp. y28]|uniref:DUF1934 domain-containing protein n=1 Tax=Paenibacillus sp. y28 TaxID=3129110 RepID=UPI0030185B18